MKVEAFIGEKRKRRRARCFCPKNVEKTNARGLLFFFEGLLIAPSKTESALGMLRAGAAPQNYQKKGLFQARAKALGVEAALLAAPPLP